MGGVATVKLLLDTHILLWSTTEPHQLASNIRHELENESNELWFSPISLWETLILAEKGKVILRPDPLICFRAIIDEFSLIEAPLTSEVAIQSRQVNLPHQDPADRFIVATAVVYGLTLITADRRIIESKRLPVMPNR